MPEQLSKHPEVTMQVLQGAGGRCGPELQPKILTKCPPQQFCTFGSGEICVYGLDRIPQMTQISVGELAGRVCPPSSASGNEAGGPAWAEAGALGVVFVLGLALGAFYNRFRRR